VLRVAAGQDLEPIDLSLPTVPKDAPSFQSVQLPTGSTGAGSSIGTGRLSGRVTRATDGLPVANALVKEASMSGEGSVRRADEQGVFEFIGLGDGEYALTAQTPEFANVHAGEYQSFAGAPLVPVKVGRSAENITLVVPQTMTIEGRILDEFGDPVPDVPAQLALRFCMGGLSMLVSADSSLTDDLGRFRFSQVAAGDYYIQVIFHPFSGSPGYPVGFAPSSWVGSIAGRIADQPGIVPDALVGIVPEDRATWTSPGAFLLPARPNLQGRFEIKGLLPGRYLAFAFQGNANEVDPALVESLAPFASTVVVVEGRETAVELTLRKR
jgi:hypothetical protein